MGYHVVGGPRPAPAPRVAGMELRPMGNWHLDRDEEPQALSAEAWTSLRHGRAAGLSRRELLRRSIAAGISLWVVEVVGGTLGFLWPNLAGGFGGQFTLGDFDTVAAQQAVPGYGLADGAPSYIQAARTYVTLLDPSREFLPGDEPAGDGVSPTPARSISAAPTSAASRTSAPGTSGSSAPAMAPDTTASEPRFRSWDQHPVASIASPRASMIRVS